MRNEFQKILAVDYGKSNIGLAVANSLIPEALTPIKVKDLDDAVSKVTAIALAINPDLIIVGMPEGNLAIDIEKFINLLQNTTNSKILTHPETLSTKEAISRLRKSGAKKTKLKKDHSFAACIILEDYLDLHPTS